VIHIENVCPDFFAFWERSQAHEADEQKQLWQTLYENRHPDLFALYYSKFGHPAGLDNALTRFDRVVPTMQALIPHLERSIANAVPLCAPLFALPGSDARFVLMVGVFASDCWVESFHDVWTSFFAVEQMTTYRPGLDIGVAHETCHVLHMQCIPAPVAVWSLAMGMFLEGLATYATSHLYPDAGDAAHLNMPPDLIAACEAQWGDVRQRILREIDQADLDRAKVYFLADPGLAAQAGLPTRVGYFVGYQIVRALSHYYSIADMARWSPDRIRTEERQALEQLEQLPGSVA